MKTWIRHNAKLLVGIGLALAVGLGGGYLIGNMQSAQWDAELDPAEPVGQIGKPSILPQTPVMVTYQFLLCGHAREQDETGGQFTGCTVEDVRKKYADASVIRLDETGAAIERELERYCPAHYQVYLENENAICIMHTDEAAFDKDVQQTLQYDVGVLAEDIQMELEEGLVMDSLEEINAYFESIES